MSGMTYVDGVPYVWGRPAKFDQDEPLLDCFGHWRCPHCNARMTADESPICLNACHLTAPQVRALTDGLRSAEARVGNNLGKENETATAAQRVGMRMIQTISKSEVVPPCNSK